MVPGTDIMLHNTWAYWEVLNSLLAAHWLAGSSNLSAIRARGLWIRITLAWLVLSIVWFHAVCAVPYYLLMLVLAQSSPSIQL
jgi:hypothetical protein